MYIDEKSASAMLKTVSIAGIEEQGVPFKRESTSLDEATQHVSISNITSKECVVDEKVSETPKILEKLNKHKPENLYDASKISGITPSALFQIVKHKKVKRTKVA